MKLNKKTFDIEMRKDESYKFTIKGVNQLEDCYFYAEDKDFLTIGSSISFFFKDSQIIIIFKGNEIEYKKMQWAFLEQMILKGDKC